MINIYDVVLNFNKNFYEVYEWNNTDNIVNIRKLPIFKVSDEILINFKYNDIILSNNSLEYLINNTFFYKDIELKEINIIVTNGKCAIGLNFDNKGVLLGRSAMLFDEESEDRKSVV